MPSGGTLRFVTRNVELDERAARSEAELTPGPYAAVDVEDTGAGMNKATIKRIFEPFFTTKPVGQGPGLGLAMCFGIVKQAGGHILVDSEPGRGSRFTVLLPRHVEEVPVPAPDSTVPAEELARGSESVLVVEDDPVVRELAVRTLRDAGYAVIEAAGADEARSAASSIGRLDLILSDVVMPGDGGPAIVRSIRGGHPEVRVLYMSGYAVGTLTTEGGLAPDTPFLPKPFTPVSLAQAVRVALDAPGPRPATGELRLDRTSLPVEQ